MDAKLLEGLTEDQKSKLMKCKTKEDLMSLIDKEGFDLSDAQMEAISGGGCGKENCCNASSK